jgi:hypothetical protein
MSLQDDYFDLSAELEGDQLEAFERIWDAFCEVERENERLSPIVSGMRNAIQLMFKDINK